MGDLLISVAGTAQAREAAIANEIPQTATVQRDVQPTPVKFDGGEPQFSAIGQQQRAPITYAGDGCRADIGELAGRLPRCAAREERKKSRRQH